MTLPEVLPHFRLDRTRLAAALEVNTFTIQAGHASYAILMADYILAPDHESFVESLLLLFNPVRIRFINSKAGTAMLPIDFLYTTRSLTTWPRLQHIVTHYVLITSTIYPDTIDSATFARTFTYELVSSLAPRRNPTFSLCVLSFMLFPRPSEYCTSIFSSSFPPSVVISVPSQEVRASVSAGLRSRALALYSEDEVAERFRRITFSIVP